MRQTTIVSHNPLIQSQLNQCHFLHTDLTENGSSRKRKFEMTVKSSAVSVVENSHRSQTNAALPAVDVSHSFVATSTHTATAMNGATGDCDLSTGAYAHNIENISEVVTSNSVHITHSKKRRLSTLAGTNIDPSSRIFITEATLVTESEAVVTKRVSLNQYQYLVLQFNDDFF